MLSTVCMTHMIQGYSTQRLLAEASARTLNHPPPSCPFLESHRSHLVLDNLLHSLRNTAAALPTNRAGMIKAISATWGIFTVNYSTRKTCIL